MCAILVVGSGAIVDPHLKKESKDDKYGILDVKVHTKNENVINVEIQIVPIPEMKQRAIYYLSKMVTEQMTSGDNYSAIKRSVAIIITDFDFMSNNGHYHNQYRYRSDKDGSEFSDLTELNTLDLSKLPTDADSTDLWYWMTFMKTGDEEVLNMLAQRSPQMRKAVGVLKELSADERTRMLYEEREKARRDDASRMGGADRNARTEIARKLLRRNRPIDEIIEDTGLTQEEIEKL